MRTASLIKSGVSGGKIWKLSCAKHRALMDSRHAEPAVKPATNNTS